MLSHEEISPETRYSTSRSSYSCTSWLVRLMALANIGLFGLRMLPILEVKAATVNGILLDDYSRECNSQSNLIKLNEVYCHRIGDNKEDYVGVSAVEEGKFFLPEWLRLEIETPTIPISNNPFALAIENNFLFALTPSGFSVSSPRDIDDFQLIANYTSISTPLAMAIVKDTVFLTLGSRGMEVVDISHVESPKQLSVYTRPACSFIKIAATDKLIFLSDKKEGEGEELHIVNVRDCKNPRELYRISLSSSNNLSSATDGSAAEPAMIQDMQLLAGKQTLILSLSGSVMAVDIVPFQKLLQKKRSIQNFSLPILFSHSCVSPGTLVQHDESVLFFRSNISLNALNISNLTQPEPLSTYSLPFDTGKPPLTLFKDMLLMKRNAVEIEFWNVKNPSEFLPLGRIYLGNQDYNDFITLGDHLYVSDKEGLRRLNFGRARLIGTPTRNDMREKKVGQSISLVLKMQDRQGKWTGKPWTLTIDEPIVLSNFILKDQRLFVNQTRFLFLHSDRLFSRPGEAFLKLSLSLMSRQTLPLPPWIKLEWEPIELSTREELGASLKAVAVSDNIAFVASNQKIEVIDITDPSDPHALIQTGGEGYLINQLSSDSISDMAILENTLYVVSQKSGLSTLEVSHPEYPNKLGTYCSTQCSIGDRHTNLLLADQLHLALLSVANANATICGIQLIDTTDKQKLAYKSTYPRRCPPATDSDALMVQDIAVSQTNKILWVVHDDQKSLIAVDISNTTQPVKIPPKSLDLPLNEKEKISGIATWEDGEDSEKIKLFLTTTEGRLIIQTGVSAVDIQYLYATPFPILQPGTRHQLTVDEAGQTLFVGDKDGGITLMEVGDDIIYPHILGTLPNSTFAARDIVISGRAAVMTNTRGYRIADLRTWLLTIQPFNQSHEGNSVFLLTATDSLGAMTSDTFTVRVEGAPRVRFPLPAMKYATENEKFTYTIPVDTFEDPNGDPLTFSAELSQNNWLNFTPLSATFEGKPIIENKDKIVSIIVNATDPLGGVAQSQFNVSVLSQLRVSAPLSSQPWVWIEGRSFNESIDLEQLFSTNNRSLTYSCLPNRGSSDNIPVWIQPKIFDTTMQITGQPPIGLSNATTMSMTSLLITVTDDLENQAVAPLVIMVHPNFPPQVRQPIPMVVARAGERTEFDLVPKDFFFDQNKDVLNYMVASDLSWLKYTKNADIMHFTARPTHWDTFLFSSPQYTVQLIAYDQDGANSTAYFDIEVNGQSMWMLVLIAVLTKKLALPFKVIKEILEGCIDRCYYVDTQGEDKEITAGEHLQIEFDPSVTSVQVQEPVETTTYNLYLCNLRNPCLGFFKPKEALIKMRKNASSCLLKPLLGFAARKVPTVSYLQLPYGHQPNWIEYDESDKRKVIRSKGAIPKIENYQELLVTVRRKWWGLNCIDQHWFFKVRENQGKEMLATAMFQQPQSPREDQPLLADKIEIELTHRRKRGTIL